MAKGKIKKTKKTLLLGSNGMLGNAIEQVFASNPVIDLYTTSREGNKTEKDISFVVDQSVTQSLEKILNQLQPDYVVNAIGLIRPGKSETDQYNAFFINSYFPRILSKIVENKKTFFIHVSTDCVFDGKKGDYTESDIPNELGVYGLSKYLGETSGSKSLTIRTSIIGREKGTTRNLLDWFLSETSPKVTGYRNVIWNGVTTITLSKIISRIIERDLRFERPVIQVASEKISKYDLLHLFKDIFEKNISIDIDEINKSDKSIVPTPEQEIHFSDLIGTLSDQIRELKASYSIQ